MFEKMLIFIQGECRSNVPEDGRNAVTWGVFPGQEIAQTTIIEKESFLTWKVGKCFTLTGHAYSKLI
jgi:methylenetetrahydrofolate reductase (NADPH)